MAQALLPVLPFQDIARLCTAKIGCVTGFEQTPKAAYRWMCAWLAWGSRRGVDPVPLRDGFVALLRSVLERRQFGAFAIFPRPPKGLRTGNRAGSLYTDTMGRKLPVGHESTKEIPARSSE